MKQFDVITIFPEILNCYFQESLFKRAQEKKLLKVNFHNLRNWASGRHQTVDGRPYGGGVGLIFKPEPIVKAIKDLKKKRNRRIILLSPGGKRFDQKAARRLAKYDQLIFIASRYEGVDARIKKVVSEEISIGDYVLTGGELAAAVIIDAVARYFPGFLGKKQSLEEDSFFRKNYLKYPQYTRPEEIIYQGKKLKVPKVLLSGDHQKIEKWRQDQSSRI